MPKPNTADAMKRYKAGKAGFTDKSHLKAKGLIPRADGTKKKSPKYEEAPANATGTAVAGTGDDSSTIPVKKKDQEKMKDRLLKRFKIKETLDMVLPDPVEEIDEVTKRKDQLKAMAIGSKEVPNYGNADNRYDRPLGEKRVAQDPDVKSKSGTQPKKYYKTLSKSEKEKRAKHFSKQDYKKSDDDDDYKPAPGDKGAKTKLSKHTKKFRQMYGETEEGFASAAQRRAAFAQGYKAKGKKKKEEVEVELQEMIKGLQNKAKKSGMPYSILKKVYDRGMAAWKGGHRPGATQQQWAFARVNSFITKGSGTWGKADSDLAKKVRASKK
tara:strand:- start:1278 stop:2255 length:978 start_codon:yes stop_codon:yes gene_type:complete